jgi:hypothetical protein
MTATATRQDSESSSAQQEAWARYHDDLRELEGREYEEAEGPSWDRLQQRLREIAHEPEEPPAQ